MSVFGAEGRCSSLERLLKTYEVAELLGRDSRWVLDQSRPGGLLADVAFTVGRAVRFRESDLETWLEGRRRGERLATRSLRVAGGKQ